MTPGVGQIWEINTIRFVLLTALGNSDTWMAIIIKDWDPVVDTHKVGYLGQWNNPRNNPNISVYIKQMEREDLMQAVSEAQENRDYLLQMVEQYPDIPQNIPR